MLSPLLRILVATSFALTPSIWAEDEVSSREAERAILTLVPITDNLVQNADFSAPINTDRKRGKWMLLTALKGSSGFDLVGHGFKVENHTLEMEMAELNPPGNSSPYAVQLSQLVPALITGKRYQLSFEARSSIAEDQVLVGVGFMLEGKMQGGLPMQTERLTTDFHPYSHEFTAENIPGTDPTKTRLDFRLGKATGVVSLQNVQLIELE